MLLNRLHVAFPFQNFVIPLQQTQLSSQLEGETQDLFVAHTNLDLFRVLPYTTQQTLYYDKHRSQHYMFSQCTLLRLSLLD